VIPTSAPGPWSFFYCRQCKLTFIVGGDHLTADCPIWWSHSADVEFRFVSKHLVIVPYPRA